MVFEVSAALLWVSEPIDNPCGDNRVLHCLIGLGLEILGDQEIRVDHGSRVERLLFQSRF